MNKKIGTVIGALVMLSLSACGKSADFVTSASVQSSVQNGDTYAQLTVNLDTYGFQLPSLNVPVVDPSDVAIQYGDVSISGSQLNILVNVTASANLPANGNLLPNGQPLPISTQGMGVIALPLGNTTARVYVGIGNSSGTTSGGTVMIGTAIPITSLDSIASYLGGVDLFPQFSDNNITGVAGIFTQGGSAPSAGLAVFLDVSNVLPGVLN